MIETTVTDGLRAVEFDRPDRRNALTPAALERLEDTLETATEPVLYLSGAGEAFCAGADIDVIADLGPDGAQSFLDQGQRVARAIERYDGVVVAGIDGPARGGGVELALACDVRVGTPDATLAQPGVELGIFGAWGGTARLPRVVGEGVALDMSVSGRVLDAQEALRVGLLSRVLDDPQGVAREILDNDSTAVRAVKHRIRDDAELATQERREAAAFERLLARREGGDDA